MIDDQVCVIVPMHNEATRVGHVVTELLAQFGQVVCIDDGSTDGSSAVAAGAGALVVRHAQNLGQGAALQTGFDYVCRHSTATWCVTFDADGQHLVDDAVRMVARARTEGIDVVLASRSNGRSGHVPVPPVRRAVLRTGVAFTRLTTRLDVSDTHNGLRVVRRDALSRIRLTQPGMAHASEFLGSLSHQRLTWVEESTSVIYDEYSRLKGQSSLNAVNVLFDLAMARLRAGT